MSYEIESLEHHHFSVFPIVNHQRIVRANLDDPPRFQNYNPIRMRDRTQTVSDDEAGAILY